MVNGPQASTLPPRARRAPQLAKQILETSRPYLSRPIDTLSVLDIGSGFGFTAAELAKQCGRVVGIEPGEDMWRRSLELRDAVDPGKLEFRNEPVEDLSEESQYDLAILDNVLEHLPDQREALHRITRALRPEGLLYIVVPNKLWPIEVHYRLPFLSYLPLKLANIYLRITGKGRDYTPSSYAPTYFGLNRLLNERTELTYQYVLPASVEWTVGGTSRTYQWGIAAIRRFPALWIVSKALLVVAVKR